MRAHVARYARNASVILLVSLPGITMATESSGLLPWPTLALSYAAPQPATQPVPPATAPQPMAGPEATEPASTYGYRGVSSFFNIREAYSNVKKGEWEFELKNVYSTKSRSRHDHFELAQSIKYGITDDFHIELEVSEPLGYSGYGVGELKLKLFNTFWHEAELLPAFGGSAELRIPTGYGSSRVDGIFTGILTKTIFPRFRAHLLGYVETANGAQGHEEEENRRAFQWGVGPGFDYQLTDDTLVLLNYLHKSSDRYGEHNNNIMEAGLVHYFPKTGAFKHGIKAAVDWTLDGLEDTPNFAAKLQWSIEW